jgi:hypothetical protein
MCLIFKRMAPRESRASFVLGFEEMHPHEMCAVVNDEEVVAEVMRGRDIDMAPNVAG